jgi:hypothetical protein
MNIAILQFSAAPQMFLYSLLNSLNVVFDFFGRCHRPTSKHDSLRKFAKFWNTSMTRATYFSTQHYKHWLAKNMESTPSLLLRPLQVIPAHLATIRIFKVRSLPVRTLMHHLAVQHLAHAMLRVPLVHDHSIDRLAFRIPTVELP